MDLFELHKYYLANGIRQAAKLAGTRTSTLTKRFLDVGLPLRYQPATKEAVLDWYNQYLLQGIGLSALAVTIKIGRKRLKHLFKKHGLALKTDAQMNKDRKEKIKKTNLTRYGVENVMQVPAHVDKLRAVVKARSSQEREETEKKRKATVLNSYGVNYYVKSEEFRKKAEQTLLKNFGVTTPSKSPAILEKRKCTRLSKRELRLKSNLHEQGYELLEPYTGSRVSIDGKHVNWKRYKLRHSCGLEFEDDVFEYPRCPTCFPLNRSREEIGLENWLRGNGYTVESNVRNLIINPISERPYEIDLVLPEQKICIEYNGSFYHAGRRDHGLKTDLCLLQGYKLYHIWDYQNGETVKSRLGSLLGKSYVIPARKTVIKKIPLQETREFCSKYHLQGETIVSYAYGLFYGGELVSILSLRKTSGTLEIARFCTKHYKRVIGGFQKLLAQVRRDFAEPILTYADRDFCPDWKDSIYAKSGFTFIKDTGPSLRYINLRTHEVYSRERLQKYKLEKLFPKFYSNELTANEILAKANIVPIWNSGNYKFILFPEVQPK